MKQPTQTKPRETAQERNARIDEYNRTHAPLPMGIHLESFIRDRKIIRQTLADHEREVAAHRHECAIHAADNGYTYRPPVLLERQIRPVSALNEPPKYEVVDFWMP